MHDQRWPTHAYHLIYAPHTTHGICETPGPRPKAWVRHDAQNIPVDQNRRDQLLRAKGFTEWEHIPCCPYDEQEIDKATLEAFRNDFLADEPARYTTQELLYKAGALHKDQDGKLSFTNAGYLFFAADPQRVHARAYIRLIKFNPNSTDANAAATEAALHPPTPVTVFANLYELTSTLTLPEGEDRKDLRRTITTGLVNRLRNENWFIDKQRFGRIAAHHIGTKVPLAPNVEQFVRIYPAYSLQVRDLWGKFYLCVDYDIQVTNVRNAQSLAAELSPGILTGMRCIVQYNGWEHGKITSTNAEHTTVYLYEYKQVITVPSTEVIPQLPLRVIKQLLHQHRINVDLHRQIKDASLALRPQAARTRAERVTATIEFLSEKIFPLSLATTTITINPIPLPLPPPDAPERLQTVPEPSVEFDQHRATTNIREGITKYGAYDEQERIIELVSICPAALRNAMATLIERLKTGSYQYRGSERTFKARLTHTTIITVAGTQEILPQIQRLLHEHPQWAANPTLNRLFLIATPITEYERDDEQAPYYQITRYLFERGIPCQTVNNTAILDPNWKDLNLALNIVAKCGITPWVLPDAIPDADFFIGLSYTRSGRGDHQRYLRYANVFSQYGRWEFYAGGGEPVPYEQRTAAFRELITSTLQRLDLPHAPHINFHYSAKFSKEDREAILAAAQTIRPAGRYTFVWINTTHQVRLYDQRPETDGSMPRGTYLITTPRQCYLSSTGFNPYRKTLGTPMTLEINSTPHDEHTAIDHRTIVTQILSLTKLNWASTDSLCAEPITTKYAGDIAYLTAAFLRQAPTFKLHPLLEQTPWFI